MQGAAGDINPVGGKTDFADVARYGTVLAGEVTKQIAVLSLPDYVIEAPRVGALSRTVPVASRQLSPLGDVQDAFREGEEAVRTVAPGPERERMERALLGLEERLERVRRGNEPVPAEVQVLRLGDTTLVGIPGEPFAEMGLAIKRGACGALPLGYANDWIGYIAPPRAWEQGGYEVSLGTWSMVGPEVFDLLLETAMSLVEELWDRRAAERAQAAARLPG